MTDGIGHLCKACHGTGEARAKDAEPSAPMMPIKAPARPKRPHSAPGLH